MTDVPWATKAWHVVRGCTKVSRGCDNCFACRLAATRLKNQPAYAGLARLCRDDGERRSYRWSGEVRCYPDVLTAPLRRRKPTVYFVAEMGDLFHKKVPFEFIAAVFGIMAATPRHTYLVLTKRPKRMMAFYEWLRDYPASVGYVLRRHIPAEMFLKRTGGAPSKELAAWHKCRPSQNLPWPLPNVWPGTSAEGQSEVDARVPQLLRVPVHPQAGHWLSLEPQLEEVDLERYLSPLAADEFEQYASCCSGSAGRIMITGLQSPVSGPRPALKGVIQGSEQLAGGRCGRPFEPEWAVSMHEQCQTAGVAYYYKQAPGFGGKVDKFPTLWGKTWRALPWQP